MWLGQEGRPGDGAAVRTRACTRGQEDPCRTPVGRADTEAPQATAAAERRTDYAGAGSLEERDQRSGGGDCGSGWQPQHQRKEGESILKADHTGFTNIPRVHMRKKKTKYHGLATFQHKHPKMSRRRSLVVQWLGIHLTMQGTQVQSLVQEDSTGHGATEPVSCTY